VCAGREEPNANTETVKGNTIQEPKQKSYDKKGRNDPSIWEGPLQRFGTGFRGRESRR